MNWKNQEDHSEIKKNECTWIELDSESLYNVNLEKYTEDIQALLINPPWNDKNFDFKKFAKIKLPLSKMKEGLIFVWTEKEYISDLVNYFDSKLVKYVENLVWVKLDSQKKGKTIIIKLLDKSSSTNEIFNLSNIFKTNSYEYFSKSHLTLLIFRKVIFNFYFNLF